MTERGRRLVRLGFLSWVLPGTIVLAAAGQQPAYRATTTVVEVETVARDGRGGFVADLRRNDFEVLEDGKPQTLETLYLVIGNQPQSAAGEESRGPVPPARPAVSIVVFDLEHMQPGHVGRARAAAERLFSKSFSHGDVGGVVAGGRMMNNRLTKACHATDRGLRRPRAKLTGRAPEDRSRLPTSVTGVLLRVLCVLGG